MTELVCAALQMRSSDVVAENIETATKLVREAAENGAHFIATPEMTGFLDIRSGGTRSKAVTESEDACLAAMRDVAAKLSVWLQIGSLAVVLDDEDRFANRSFLIGPYGDVRARYDKIHMFDVDVDDGQAYRESRAYRPGEQSVLARTPDLNLGMTICYDVRFAYLYRALAQAGAQLITVPAAFTKVTGEAHWHVLLRARAIETGCFIIAPAQGGKHADGRETFGHSLIISPWGEILAEGGTEPGIVMATLDMSQVEKARRKIPSLKHDRSAGVNIVDAT